MGTILLSKLINAHDMPFEIYCSLYTCWCKINSVTPLIISSQRYEGRIFGLLPWTSACIIGFSNFRFNVSSKYTHTKPQKLYRKIARNCILTKEIQQMMTLNDAHYNSTNLPQLNIGILTAAYTIQRVLVFYYFFTQNIFMFNLSYYFLSKFNILILWTRW